MTNNQRFCMLGGRRRPNLASQVLAMTLRRLSRDFEARWGHPVDTKTNEITAFDLHPRPLGHREPQPLGPRPGLRRGPLQRPRRRRAPSARDLRNLAISLLRLAGFKNVARGLRWAAWDHTRALGLMGL